jgi:hypothetical protein
MRLTLHRHLVCAWGAACMAAPSLAAAAADAAAEAPPAGPPYTRHVGEATHRLLALQREGRIASEVPRPVPGEVAQRSRARYLKSFEHEIPEHFKSSVGEKKSGTGSR